MACFQVMNIFFNNSSGKKLAKKWSQLNSQFFTTFLILTKTRKFYHCLHQKVLFKFVDVKWLHICSTVIVIFLLFNRKIYVIKKDEN